MKTKTLLIFLAFLCMPESHLKAQTVLLTPNSATIPEKQTITFYADAYNFGSCGDKYGYTYTWKVYDNSNLSVALTTATTTTPTYKYIFNNKITYRVTVTIATKTGGGCPTSVSSTSTATITVIDKSLAPAANLYAVTAYGNMISAFSMNTGTITSGPYDYFDPFPTTTQITSAIGRSPNGYFYYLPASDLTNDNNNGVVNVMAVKSDGTGTPVIVATLDFNGTSSNDLGLFRLGFDASGTGWILVGDGIQLYLAKFTPDKLNTTPITLVNNNVTISGGGSPSDFQSGDLAFSSNGTMYVIAGSNAGTSFYTMQSPNSSEATLTHMWNIRTTTGANFTSLVTGTVFDNTGDMYISAIDGLYIIDQSTINSFGFNTVQARKLWTGYGLMDLSTNSFPVPLLSSPVALPVNLEYFNGELNNSTNKLSWKTSMEDNIQGFRVQRSFNGSEFKDIALVFSAGTGSTYKYNDPLPSASNTVYYRLKVLEPNDRYSYSKTISVKPVERSLTVTIGPTPLQSQLQITINNTKAEEINLMLFEPSGIVIKRSNLQVNKGTNSFFINNLGNLRAGIYILQLSGSEGTQSYKVLKN
jgi:hypothetical protein